MKVFVLVTAVCTALAAIIFSYYQLNKKPPEAIITDNDPYGIFEYEETGEISDKLIACSQDENCPEHANALFWLAVNHLMEAGSETIEVDMEDFESGIIESDDGSITLASPFDEFLQQISGPPRYDLSDPNFQRGLELLNEAHVAGSAFASNEIGLLYLEQEAMRDLDLAESYFDTAIERGDANGTYNMARLSHARSPEKTGRILNFLKMAAQESEENFEVFYLFGVEAFGENDEALLARQKLNAIEEDISRFKDDFESHFLTTPYR
ncbi:MAG: hypothetical protein AAGJ85_06315 [Pseudomonadota bacterium]